LTFRPCALIPVFDHSTILPAIVEWLRGHGLPCLLVDDGSSSPHARVIARLGKDDGVEVVTHPHNMGKGAAVKTGFRRAWQRGFSHALQIDADGQHDLDDVGAFLSAAKVRPGAVICGYPLFDDSIPRGRYYSRYLTHVWVWINTLSFTIPDAMCGFRVYPLVQLIPLLEQETTGDRMDFDIEVLVRLYWREVPMVWVPTRVRYQADGISHFRLVEDNWHISSMHARLFFTLMARKLIGRGT